MSIKTHISFHQECDFQAGYFYSDKSSWVSIDEISQLDFRITFFDKTALRNLIDRLTAAYKAWDAADQAAEVLDA